MRPNYILVFLAVGGFLAPSALGHDKKATFQSKEHVEAAERWRLNAQQQVERAEGAHNTARDALGQAEKALKDVNANDDNAKAAAESALTKAQEDFANTKKHLDEAKDWLEFTKTYLSTAEQRQADVNRAEPVSGGEGQSKSGSDTAKQAAAQAAQSSEQKEEPKKDKPKEEKPPQAENKSEEKKEDTEKSAQLDSQITKLDPDLAEVIAKTNDQLRGGPNENQSHSQGSSRGTDSYQSKFEQFIGELDAQSSELAKQSSTDSQTVTVKETPQQSEEQTETTVGKKIQLLAKSKDIGKPGVQPPPRGRALASQPSGNSANTRLLKSLQ
jgi:hypothetical protein